MTTCVSPIGNDITLYITIYSNSDLISTYLQYIIISHYHCAILTAAYTHRTCVSAHT